MTWVIRPCRTIFARKSAPRTHWSDREARAAHAAGERIATRTTVDRAAADRVTAAGAAARIAVIVVADRTTADDRAEDRSDHGASTGIRRNLPSRRIGLRRDRSRPSHRRRVGRRRL